MRHGRVLAVNLRRPNLLLRSRPRRWKQCYEGYGAESNDAGSSHMFSPRYKEAGGHLPTVVLTSQANLDHLLDFSPSKATGRTDNPRFEFGAIAV